MRVLFIATGYLPYTFSENLVNAKLVDAMVKHGWEVDVISKKDEGPSYSIEWKEPWTYLKKSCYEINYSSHKLLKYFDYIYSGWKMGNKYMVSIRWARRAYEKAIELSSQNNYDVVITRSPNDIAHFVGYKLKNKLGIKWIANWNDPAVPIWPYPYKHNLSSRKQKIEEKKTILIIETADINTFPSEQLRDHFIQHFPILSNKRTEIIPHIALLDSLFPKKETTRSTKLRICHSGNLSIERNPENLFKALREIIDSGIQNLVFDIMGVATPFTEKLIKKYNLHQFVNIIGSYPYFESLEKLQEYDILLLLEANLDNGIFFASKIVDYVQANRPILALSPSKGFAKDFIEKHKCGIVVDNTNYIAIKETFLKLYLQWKENKIVTRYNNRSALAELAPSVIMNKYQQIYNSL